MSFNLFRLFCYLGMGLIALGIVYSASYYRGKQGEKFSILNHFISELGEVGINSAAWAFNLSLILGGLITIPFVVGLGIKFNSVLGWLGMAAGLTTTLGVTAVGLFPMNNMGPHVKAAQTYFRAGLVMVLLFGLAILFQPAGNNGIRQIANLLSLLAFVAYAAFLLLVKPRKPDGGSASSNPLDPTEKPERPRVWLFPILEWGVFFATLVWLFGMAFFI